MMVKIPMVNTIYGSMKKLLDSLQQKPDSVQRVVLIPFPDNRKRAVGFVTKTFRDTTNDRSMAVVFVPMSPNPTGGFLEILPVKDLISTDWTMDEAMTFIVSGGAVAPENLDYFQNEVSPEELEKNPDYNNLYKEESSENENES
jgi:uncharacterized membrane protein